MYLAPGNVHAQSSLNRVHISLLNPFTPKLHSWIPSLLNSTPEFLLSCRTVALTPKLYSWILSTQCLNTKVFFSIMQFTVRLLHLFIHFFTLTFSLQLSGLFNACKTFHSKFKVCDYVSTLWEFIPRQTAPENTNPSLGSNPWVLIRGDRLEFDG